MHDLINTIVFGWFPYLVLAVFLLGISLRVRGTRPLWPGGGGRLLNDRQLMVGASLALAGVLTLFAGHFIGLLTPIRFFEMIGISHGFKQQMAIAIGGVAGVIGFAGVAVLSYRVLADAQIRSLFSFGELTILLLLFIQLTLGLDSIVVSLKFIDGCAMVKFMSWAQGIMTLNPGAAAQVAGVPLIFKVHMALGMTILMVVPFTRAVTIWRLPAWYFGRRSRQSGPGRVSAAH